MLERLWNTALSATFSRKPLIRIRLFRSIPSLTRKEKRLNPIDGLMPDPANLPGGCCFHPRCPYADETCRSCHPDLSDAGNGHKVRCFHLEEAKMGHREVKANG